MITYIGLRLKRAEERAKVKLKEAEERYEQRVAERMALQESKRASKEQTSPIGVKIPEEAKTSGQKSTSDGSSAATSMPKPLGRTELSPKASKTMHVFNFISSKFKPDTGLPDEDMRRSVQAAGQTLLKTWQRDMSSERGDLKVQGLVRVSGSKGTALFDVIALFNPMTNQINFKVIVLRSMSGYTMRPKGGG